jgi:hypothetical protein
MDQEPLIEGRDYYLEKGRYVFTAYFLTQRGYCCKNSCRHCPYGFLKEAMVESKPLSGIGDLQKESETK